MPNWTAMRYRFKRSRRAQILAALGALLLLFVLNSIVASFLRPDAPPAPVGTPENETPISTGRIDVPAVPVDWRVGDYWVWEGGHGLRVVDRVVDVTYVGPESNRVALYHVQREASAANGANPRVDNITYDSRTLSVVNQESRSFSVEWHQRTLGLTYFSKNGGFISNATVTYDSGRNVYWYRVSNVTETDASRITVPAGRFDDVRAATIQYYDLDVQDTENSRIVQWSHWYSPSVGNDIRFTLTNGTLLRLTGFRAKDGFVPAPEPPVTPSWRVGQSWTYGDSTGAERRFEIVSAKAGVVRARVTVATDTSRIEDTMHFRASDLALINYTAQSVPFRFEPVGLPLLPDNGSYLYTKYVDAAGPERPYDGNATVVVSHGAVIATEAGDFPARRTLILEQERDLRGQRATFQTIRYFSPDVANDVRIVEPSGRVWTLKSFDLGPRPLRGDALPPPG